MDRKFKICCLILILTVLCGCLVKSDDAYVIPVNYTGEALMKVYTEKSENTYNVNIVCRNNNYSIRTDAGNKSWNAAFLSDKRCILSNGKFPESSIVIENFVIGDLLVNDFDFGKFYTDLDTMPEELVYWDGTYKHVLNFSKENLLPSTIYIYKNDNLVKAIQYKKISIEE
ncbi:MAG: hypothetical protein SA378_09650 [Sedimentibacter sp.]|uniref:hypothetical protein n=1 Tax=Sedimentibacter sp. TaxID=1960295 RepID=UPI00298178C2|nr:hypothetical protein [Sedimentibacter sp.]MDW5300387.1 hypothetical protein [Sedimentibacter sp.]